MENMIRNHYSETMIRILTRHDFNIPSTNSSTDINVCLTGWMAGYNIPSFVNSSGDSPYIAFKKELLRDVPELLQKPTSMSNSVLKSIQLNLWDATQKGSFRIFSPLHLLNKVETVLHHTFTI